MAEVIEPYGDFIPGHNPGSKKAQDEFEKLIEGGSLGAGGTFNFLIGAHISLSNPQLFDEIIELYKAYLIHEMLEKDKDKKDKK